MGNDRHDKDERERQQALRDLDRISKESDPFGTSVLSRGADKAKRHFLAEEADGEDAPERWGRMIGRGLSLILLVCLVWYLARTYL